MNFHTVQLKLNGVNPQTHLIANEMDRIKRYTIETADLQNKANRLKIDKEAVERIVKSNVGK
ncbi:hypothetical protein BEWA_033250 [Theileria equi strain WA]|uniref:Uncharacterized protein n=1 Tax=Theileria equi strain WA TaxID=1537102 RepID=L0AY14_THEEQ|nr:hypothetical protein BEWA_033250 [Theileria equi strain WA]AFZ80472.1 hypothetical protein BEWA_033250 [Theileria equi strain WA]|eukprot:XP_004830138.1 hypothetical protein BEWA_033250 [Theileria equi strain WA]